MNKKHIGLIIKIIVILAAFALVFSKTDLAEIGRYLKSANLIYIILAIALLALAQLVSALRERMYFAQDNIPITRKFAAAFYFVGMFLNMFLPGGISGDGYKIFLISKLSQIKKTRALQITLSQRASGLLVLIIFCSVFAYFSDLKQLIPYFEILLITGLVATFVGYFVALKLILKEKIQTALKAWPYSCLIQIAGILSVLMIIFSFTETHNISEINGYLLLFLISSILSVIPISIGGVGIREVTFLYGAKIIHLNIELGVAIAVIYFIINLICSSAGALFWHRLEKIYMK